MSDSVWCMTMTLAFWILLTIRRRRRRKKQVRVTHVSPDLIAVYSSHSSFNFMSLLEEM